LAVLVSNPSSRATPLPEANGSKVQRKEELPKTSLESAEVKWRVVGLRRKSTNLCPQVIGWKSEDWLTQALSEPQDKCQQNYQSPQRRLDLQQVVAAAPLLRDLGLDRFCIYTYRGGTTNPPPFPNSLPDGLVSAANSHMALVPAGDPDLEPAKTFVQHFLAQASGMPEVTSAPEVIPDPKVRLVFVDTQATGDGLPQKPGPSKHGYTLVHLADELVCRGTHPCSVELATRLALSHTEFEKNPPPAGATASSQGGNLGLVDELAAAIANEVLLWLPDSKHKHLILNLSLGWDGEMLGELDKRSVSQLKPDAQLVYKALQFARRNGALVIAAAGNRRGGEESKWPVLPAAWESHSPSWFPFSCGRKLVYAVGGVDWQGLPLPNYRLGGIPRRVAFGDHAVAQTESPDEPTAIYTGSSVSTAVVSSIAAAVWQERPELGAAEVMKLLDRSGDFLPGRADYYAWRNLWPLSKLMRAPHLERLSLCQAVALARRERGLSSIPACQSWDPKDGAAKLSSLFPPFTALTELQPVTLPTACNSASNPAPRLFAASQERIATLPEPDKSSCPLKLLPDMITQRWVHPQPDAEPCPGCSFVPPRVQNAALTLEDVQRPPQGYVLAIEIDQEWLPNSKSHHIDSAAIDVDCYSGAGQFVERTTYAIPQADLQTALTPGMHRLLVSEVGNGGSLKGCTATINFKVTSTEEDGTIKSYSVQSPIYVDP